MPSQRARRAELEELPRVEPIIPVERPTAFKRGDLFNRPGRR
jgi:hypothetical protein